MSWLREGLRSRGFLAYAALMVALLPMPHVLPVSHLILLSYGITYAIAALGFNLLATYTGLLSFGHAAYFAAGGYAVAMLARYLPQYYSFKTIFPVAILSALALSALFGAVCVRHTRLFFAILTLALTMLVYVPLVKFYDITGGSDGLPVPLPIDMDKYEFLKNVYWYFLLASFAASLVIMRLIVSSPFGKALQAIRDNEVRAKLVGIPIKRYRFYAFVISGVFTGYAGALWSVINGHVTPEIADWLYSGKFVYMTLLGGLGTFSGPVLGALLFTYIELYALGATEYWMLVMGATIVLLTLLLPGGLMELVRRAEGLLARGG